MLDSKFKRKKRALSYLDVDQKITRFDSDLYKEMYTIDVFVVTADSITIIERHAKINLDK